jgi:hypothetical protein
VLDRDCRLLSTYNIKDTDALWIRGVNQGKDISTEGDVSCVQELYSQTLELGGRHKLALVVINDEILAGIN